MLNNQSETTEGPTPNPQFARRVTPEEFSAAVAALQKRKAEQEKLLSETVAVDDVVKELNLDSSPEDILAEVERQRQEKIKAAQAKAAAEARRSEARQADAYSTETSRLTRIGTGTRYSQGKPRKTVGGWVKTIICVAIASAALSAMNGADFRRIFAENINEPLTNVSAGHHVTISNSELDRLLQGANPSSITVTDNKVLEDAPWTIVKEDGQYYIWAYAISPLPPDVNKKQMTLYNAMHDVPTDDATELTVPIAPMKGDSVYGEGDNGMINVNGLVLDNHKDDDWSDN